MTIDIVGPIGMPPAAHTTTDIIQATMPIAQFHPCEPEFQPGMTLFRMNRSKGSADYLAMLEHYGYNIGLPVEIAFLADNFPTDSFANTYGESFLQKATDVVSQASGEISQMMGAQNAGEAVKNMANALKKSESAIGKGLGGAVDSAHGALKDIFGAIAPKGTARGGAVDTMSQMLAGARIDFPQVWKNSGFAPSYTMTVRLYNPNPASIDATKKWIIGPIAALLLLGVPRTQDGSTYNWPLLHQIKAPGIFNLDPGFISNITVVKGGDQQSIAWNQRMGIVDVRLDIGSLYNSMMGGTSDDPFRPNIKQYIDGLEEEFEVFEGTFYDEPDGTNSTNPKLSGSGLLASNGQSIGPVDSETTPDSRTSSDSQNLYADLKLRQPAQLLQDMAIV